MGRTLPTVQGNTLLLYQQAGEACTLPVGSDEW